MILGILMMLSTYMHIFLSPDPPVGAPAQEWSDPSRHTKCETGPTQFNGICPRAHAPWIKRAGGPADEREGGGGWPPNYR